MYLINKYCDKLLYLLQSTRATPSTTILISTKIYQRTVRKVSIKNTTTSRKTIFTLQTISMTQKIRMACILAQITPSLETVSVLLRGIPSTSSLTGTNCLRKFTDTPSTEFPDTIMTNSIICVQRVLGSATTDRSGRTVFANSRARSRI